MKKEYMLLSVLGVCVVFGIFLYSLSTQRTNQLHAIPFFPQATPTAIPVPTGGGLTPEAVTKNFYSWYVSYQGNPLSTGAYQTSPYLADSFIQFATDSYKNFATAAGPDYDPIFCTQNQTKNFYIERAVYDPSNKNKATVMIDEQHADGKSLYKVLLINIYKTWKIYDIYCQ